MPLQRIPWSANRRMPARCYRERCRAGSVHGERRVQFRCLLELFELDHASVELGLPLDTEKCVSPTCLRSRSALVGTSDPSRLRVWRRNSTARGSLQAFDVSYLKAGYTATSRRFAPGASTRPGPGHPRLLDCAPAKRD